METTLHRQLKEHYAGVDGETEVTVDKYRIDAIVGEELIEIQLGSLSAIRLKIERLLKKHRIRIVKPIIERRRIIKLTRKNGKVKHTRWSPKRGNINELFDELIYFTRVFPHKNLTLEVPLVVIQEERFPGHGRKRWRRKNDYQVRDQSLLEVQSSRMFATASDMASLIPADALPSPFDTAQLATAMSVERWFAQRVAYCLRHFGTIKQAGKKGNALLYELPVKKKRLKKKRAKKKRVA